jgi:hypothetical protein
VLIPPVSAPPFQQKSPRGGSCRKRLA